MYDLIIRNGRIADGSGMPAFTADMAIQDGRVARIGRIDSEAAEIIDAGGKVVAPGFIDPHSHGEPLETPEFENFLAMGVTTISLGQDGSSPEVADIGGYLQQVAADGVGVNVAMFVGHGTLRDQVGIGMQQDPDLERQRRKRQRSSNAYNFRFLPVSGCYGSRLSGLDGY